MKVSELDTQTVTELQAKERDLEQELFNLRFQLHTGRLENTARVSLVRKDIARIKTIIRQKMA